MAVACAQENSPQRHGRPSDQNGGNLKSEPRSTVEMKFQEAYNNRDAAAIAALYTGDAVEVRTWQGTFSGQEAIMRVFADEFALSPGKMVNKLLQVHQTWTGDICGMMDTSVGLTKGHVIRIYVPSADTWKIRMTYVRF